MLKDTSGGDGIPSPPEVPVVTVPPPPVGMDSSSSEKNPPGFGKETSLGTADAKVLLTSLVVNTLEYETNQLYTVQEQTEEEEAEEEMKAPKPTEEMDTEQVSITACKSLSFTSEDAILHGKAPPCHLTMDLSNRKESTGWKWEMGGFNGSRYGHHKCQRGGWL
jgi:hypothetical protein